jgi:hypothetical protein
LLGTESVDGIIQHDHWSISLGVISLCSWSVFNLHFIIGSSCYGRGRLLLIVTVVLELMFGTILSHKAGKDLSAVAISALSKQLLILVQDDMIIAVAGFGQRSIVAFPSTALVLGFPSRPILEPSLPHRSFHPAKTTVSLQSFQLSLKSHDLFHGL